MNEDSSLVAPDVSSRALTELVELTGRVAVITGGARGIGWAIAARLAEAGAHVCIGDRDEAAASAAAEELTARYGVRALAVAADVASAESVERLAETSQSLGELSIWVNNAAIYPASSVLDLDDAEWRSVLDIDLTGTMLGARAAARLMRTNAAPGKVIVNVGSVSGMRGRTSLAAYVAAKHGVHGLTKTLALELAPLGIRVVAVAPSMVDTPGMRARREGVGDAEAEQLEALEATLIRSNPSRRQAVPDDIARAVWFLSTDAATYLTGAVVPVDGGVTAG